MKMHIKVDVVTFRKKDNGTLVTTVENGIKVCKISFNTRSELSNK